MTLPGALLAQARPTVRPADSGTVVIAPAAGNSALPARVSEVLRRAQVSLRDVSVHAQAVDATEPLISLNAQEPFVLASTAKLVTSMSALDLLGPGFRWKTSAFLDGVLRDGRLDGDLILMGGGDPLLDDQILQQWFGRMIRRGLRTIGGNIVIDRRLFSLNEKELANTPKPSWDNSHHVYPDAFLVNEGQLEVQVQTAPDGPKVLLRPELPAIHLDVRLLPFSGRCQDRRVPLTATWRAEDATIVVAGEWAADCARQSITLAPLTHAQLAHAVVAVSWRKAGGMLEGHVVDNPAPASGNASAKGANTAAGQRESGRGSSSSKVRPLTPPRARLWMVHESSQLLDALREMNKWSNNVISRQVFLSLSAEFPKRAATLGGARDAVRNWLSTRGLTESEISLDNGSGLSRDERGHALALVRLLNDAWSSRIARPLVDSMSIVGIDGTLGNRLKASPVAGRAFMKSGTLTAVRAVAGYVHSRSGRHYAMVVNVNHQDAARSLAAIDALIEWVYLNG